MPWDRTTPTKAKYRSKAHRLERARLVRQMERAGYLVCAQPMCVMPTRIIHAGEGWHLGHDDSGTEYIGPTHARCNLVDAAVRSNGRPASVAPRWNL